MRPKLRYTVTLQRTPGLRIFATVLLILLTISAPISAQPSLRANASLHLDLPLGGSDPIYLQALQDFRGIDLTGKDGPLGRIGFDLTWLHAQYQAYISGGGLPNLFQTNLPTISLTHSPTATYVVIDAIADQSASTLRAALELLGLQYGETYGAVVSGEMPISALPDVAALISLRFARPAWAETDMGAALSQGDRAMGSDNARIQYGIDGAGVKLGLLSDSYNCLGGAANDVASGDLPPNVELLADENGCKTGKDEGRAMLQLVTDSAPGADLAFHTALGGQAAFANAILELANDAHARVIVDDLRYLAEPMFQDGIIAQAVDQVAATGVAYFASAGNNARQAYESPFVSALGLLPIQLPIVGTLHDFDPGAGVDPLQQVTIPVGATATFNLQWDQPYASATGGAGAASDLDMVLLGLTSLSPIALAIDHNVGGDPIEILRYTNPGPGDTFNLAILLVSGPKPTHMKYVYSGSHITVDEYGTQSGTLYGHANAAGAMAVGSSFFLFTPAFNTTPPTLESASSAGPTPILFDHNDAPINQVRQKPEIVAPDGTNNTFFGTDINDPGDGSDSDSFPNFFGTSAAAPHAAALAALLLAANPTLTPTQLYSALEGNAIDMGQSGFDYDSGYGLMQAIPALAEITRHDVVSTQTRQPATALPGQWVKYVISLKNQGPNPTLHLTVSDTVPNGLLQTAVAASPDTGIATVLTADSPSLIANLDAGESHLITVTGRIDPHLSVDSTFVNQTAVTSAGDDNAANNQSKASVAVHVPRVQFDSSVATEGQDGSKIFSITIDQVNPYADVQVHYTTTSNKKDSGYAPISGEVTIPAGQSTVKVTLPAINAKATADEIITLQLSQPAGSTLGALISVTLASNPDSDNDGVGDNDDDGPQDPCVPDKGADGCDQEPDGLTNGEEKEHKTDPTNPDSDGDGVSDGDEVHNGSDPLSNCDPNPDADACDRDGDGLTNGEERTHKTDPTNPDSDGDGITDGDEVHNGSNPLNRCDPNANGDICGEGSNDEDGDGDGTTDDSDPAPHDPCIPNPNNPMCIPTNHPDEPQDELFLPMLQNG